jgi:hydrogenase maturation protease
MLVIGYGNPGRQDDGLGPAAADALAALEPTAIDVSTGYQLAIEDGLAAAAHDLVVFVDAARDGAAPFAVTPVEPLPHAAFTTHDVSPGQVLAIARDLYGRAPTGVLVAIRGYRFDFALGLTPEARRNLALALDWIRGWTAAR